MSGAGTAFQNTCNNCHKKGHFFNVDMSINKSLDYLDNQNMPPTITKETLDKGNFFIGAIFDISDEFKINNQQINTIEKKTNIE